MILTIIWNWIWGLFHRDYQAFGAERSSKWCEVRNAFIQKNPFCKVCEKTDNLTVHHKKPFHIFPELELEPSNLITLCESAGMHCHITFGHLGDFKRYNPNVEEDVKVWNKKIKDSKMTNKDRLMEIVRSSLGTDITPLDKIPDTVACAETICTLLQKVFPDFPMLPSTKDLDLKLFSDKRFQRISQPEEGAIIMSPRTDIKNGHVGIMLSPILITSNTSKNGLFIQNYTLDSWKKSFAVDRGLPVYFYRVL